MQFNQRNLMIGGAAVAVLVVGAVAGSTLFAPKQSHVGETPEAHAALETSFNAIAEESRGAIQLRDVIRPAVPASELQTSLLSTLAGRAATFNVDGTIKADDAVSTALVTELAPLLKDLRGIEVLVSAGNVDRALAVKQAEAVKTALVAAGADASGLRPVPAPQNNPLAFIVREKE